MDTIKRAKLTDAVRALGYDPEKVDHVHITPEFVTTSRTTGSIPRLNILACQHLGFPAEDVLDILIEPDEVTVTLCERDEHGNKLYRKSYDPHGNECLEVVTRVERCNVGA